jgi:hypothetical protein
MRKFGVFSITVFLTIVIAGLYGIVHDEITYSISPEYFTKLKFIQFGFEPSDFGGHRATVAVIGFLATWWVGLIIGIILASVALIYPDHVSMRKAITRAIPIIFITAILFSFFGYLQGKYYLTKAGVDWWLPSNLEHKDDYIIVGAIHNFSYLGGGAGLIFGLVYVIGKRLSNRQR